MSHMLVTIEAWLGIISIALITGLVFAKASRPSSPALFSKNMVIANHGGKRALIFRVGNARGSDVVDASISASALVDIVTDEGEKMRSLMDLKFRRTRTPVFAVTWTVFHDIDEDSPLFGATKETLEEHLSVIIVTLTGHDATYAQTTYGRHLYETRDIYFDHRFIDVMSVMEDGNLMIDYEHFHSIEPIAALDEPIAALDEPTPSDEQA